MAYVTLTIDHRVVDGHQTNAWLSRFVEILEKLADCLIASSGTPVGTSHAAKCWLFIPCKGGTP